MQHNNLPGSSGRGVRRRGRETMALQEGGRKSSWRGRRRRGCKSWAVLYNFYCTGLKFVACLQQRCRMCPDQDCTSIYSARMIHRTGLKFVVCLQQRCRMCPDQDCTSIYSARMIHRTGLKFVVCLQQRCRMCPDQDFTSIYSARMRYCKLSMDSLQTHRQKNNHLYYYNNHNVQNN